MPAIQSAGGCFLARVVPGESDEGGINERVALVEFDSVDKAVAVTDNARYKEALKALGTGNVERDMRVVEGVAERLHQLRKRIAPRAASAWRCALATTSNNIAMNDMMRPKPASAGTYLAADG